MTDESSSNNWFDPRLTVFIIWGIFVILFICIPSKRLVARICFFMGCKCCDYEYEEEMPPEVHSRDDVDYEFLSNSRKQEIDALRASHICYRLFPFSMTLGKKDLVRRGSETEASSSARSAEDPPPQDRAKQARDTGDIEMADAPASNAEHKEEVSLSGEMEFTHILVPQPGHNFDDVDLTRADAFVEETPKDANKKLGLGSRLFSKVKDEEVKRVDEHPVKKLQEGPEKAERRRVPIFCAVCLQEFEDGERVAWSANSDCSHVFHEDCIVRWLVSLGRTKAKTQRFSDEPTESQLLGYDMECPCCRQDFVTKSDLGGGVCSGEESV